MQKDAKHICPSHDHEVSVGNTRFYYSRHGCLNNLKENLELQFFNRGIFSLFILIKF